MEFGHILKTLRIEAGVGLRELARAIDISPSYLSMIERGQLPPPAAKRIREIEQALHVPSGYLFCVTHALGPDLNRFVQDVPEAVDFLRMAKEKGMKSGDFMELTGLLNAYGLKGLKLSIRTTALRGDKSSILDSQSRGNGSQYLWPFLREELIFDTQNARNKETFLKKAVTEICERTDGLDRKTILKDLLGRESEASTGIGHGVAVPHVYTIGFDKMIVAVFRIPGGLDFDAIDGKPVHLVFILAGPRSSGHLHLKLLARIARLFSHNSFYETILKAPGRKEIILAFKAAETRIP